MEGENSLLNQVHNDIKNALSEKRYRHSVGVMKRAEELAIKYGVDVTKAKLVGIAHDIAKEMPKEEKVRYCHENGIKIDEIEAVNVELLHAKIGADICKKKYAFSEDMQEAILYHTVGSPKMDDLAKILLIADKTEAGRTYLDFAKIKEEEEKGLNILLLYILDQSIEYIMEQHKQMHPAVLITKNHFLEVIKNDMNCNQ